jgi:hypothetical protein
MICRANLTQRMIFNNFQPVLEDYVNSSNSNPIIVGNNGLIFHYDDAAISVSFGMMGHSATPWFPSARKSLGK